MASLEKSVFTHSVSVLFVLIITSCGLSSSIQAHKGKLRKFQQHPQTNDTLPLQQWNLTLGKLDWEGGSFPYEEEKPEEKDSVFYNRAVLVAPIVGSVFIIILLFIGVYSLRHYEIPEMTRGKDVESLCENCSRTRAEGIRNKIQNYVMRLFDVSSIKQDAYFIQMDPRSRTVDIQENREARETLV